MPHTTCIAAQVYSARPYAALPPLQKRGADGQPAAAAEQKAGEGGKEEEEEQQQRHARQQLCKQGALRAGWAALAALAALAGRQRGVQPVTGRRATFLPGMPAWYGGLQKLQEYAGTAVGVRDLLRGRVPAALAAISFPVIIEGVANYRPRPVVPATLQQACGIDTIVCLWAC